MADLDLAFSTAVDQARLVAERRISPVELVDNALARIDQVNGELNAFCFVWADEARAAAARSAQAVADSEPLGPLHGVPVALKDTTPTAGHRTTLGSYTHEQWIPDHDARIVDVLRGAGAIIVGKTTTPEFAHTLVTESPLWGVTRNPWNLDRTPGGSSGGSAVAVATGCVALAEGSDMGGSVRIPAAWCGVVGLKPGIGRIPMDVLPGLFDSLSHHGPLARTVDDARLFLQVAQGPDDVDILSTPVPLDLSSPLTGDVTGLRVALSIDLGSWAVDPSVESVVRQAAANLAGAGAVVDEVDLRFDPGDVAVWDDLWSVYMATYYGRFLDEFRDRMSPRVVALIEAGMAMSAVDLKRTELARTRLWRALAPVLATHDVLVCPTMATGPLPASIQGLLAPEPPDDGRLYLPEMTSVFNLVAPCPALSVPGGFDADGLPVGVQIVGRRWRDDVVLNIGRAIERLTSQLGRPVR